MSFEHLFAPKPAAQVRGNHSVLVVCCLFCEVKVVMSAHLTGQRRLQRGHAAGSAHGTASALERQQSKKTQGKNQESK